MLWQVQVGEVSAKVQVDGGALDAVMAFHRQHPKAQGPTYAKPLDGIARTLGDYKLTRRVIREAIAAAKAAAPATPTVEHMEAETDTEVTEHVAEVRRPGHRRQQPAPAPVAVAVAKTVDMVRTAVPAAKSGGVIGALVALLSDGEKRTREELYKALVVQFPDRASETGGMRNTIGVQLTQLKTKGHDVVSCASDRGKLFYIL